MIKALILKNNQILITKIEEVPSELGEPDCKLSNPFVLNRADGTMTSWLSDVTDQNNFMIHSDKILTIFDPKPSIIEKYQNLIK